MSKWINTSEKLPTVKDYMTDEEWEQMNNRYEWISVKDRLPEHQQPVLAFAITKSGKAGYGVAIFCDSIKMNEDLKKTPYAHECVDINKNPYYFVSQEQKRHTYNVVTHWMPLPEPPND